MNPQELLLQSKTLSSLIEDLTSGLLYKFIIIILAWLVIKTLKDWISLKLKRHRLIANTVLSIDTWVEICGKTGVLTYIGSHYIKLVNTKYIYHIPIQRAVDSIVTRKKYKEEKT